MNRQTLLIYRAKGRSNDEPWQALAKAYTVLFAPNLSQAKTYLTAGPVACIATELPADSSPPVDEILYFRSLFQTIPILVYSLQDAEAAFMTVSLAGPVRLVSGANSNHLQEELAALVQDYSFSADLSVFGIQVENCSRRVKKALNLIQKNFLHKPFSVAHLALQFNVHRCHFEREFQHNCHISPKQLIVGLQLFFACFMMQNAGLKLLHVAQLAGFSDYFEFCKIFRKHLGMPPSEFRAAGNEGNFFQHFKAAPVRSCNNSTANITFGH